MSEPYPGIIPIPCPGVELRLGPYKFFLPPMLMRAFRQTLREGLLSTIDSIKLGPKESPDSLDAGVAALVTILHRSLIRNYPAITEQQIEDVLDINNFGDIVGVVLNVNLALADRPTWAGPWGVEQQPPTPLPLSTPPSGPTSSVAS